MTWMDEDSIEASTNFDNGNLSHAKDPSYVVHFGFIATKDQKQRFYWKPGGRAAKILSWDGQAAVTYGPEKENKVNTAAYCLISK